MHKIIYEVYLKSWNSVEIYINICKIGFNFGNLLCRETAALHSIEPLKNGTDIPNSSRLFSFFLSRHFNYNIEAKLRTTF